MPAGLHASEPFIEHDGQTKQPNSSSVDRICSCLAGEELEGSDACSGERHGRRGCCCRPAAPED